MAQKFNGNKRSLFLLFSRAKRGQCSFEDLSPERELVLSINVITKLEKAPDGVHTDLMTRGEELPTRQFYVKLRNTYRLTFS